MTKEEILIKAGVTYINKAGGGTMMIREYVPGDDVIDILKAMDEYSKQQVIAFNDWSGKEGYFLMYNERAIWRTVKVKYPRGFTTEELYSKFMDNKTNDK